jgi:hypothetical protein
MALSTAISRVTTPLVLALVYLVFLTPIAVLRRTLGRSPIARDGQSRTFWVRREQRSSDATRSGMEHQF